MRDISFPYLPKDFIQTKEGLIFAVVSYQAHEGKVACFLRYVLNDGVWGKIDTEDANLLLQQNYPKYCYKSVQVDAVFHAVEVSDIVEHHRPEQRLQDVLQREPQDEIEVKLHKLIPILVRYGVERHNLGLTGSMLINQQHKKSDIDLVVYGRGEFHKTRQALSHALADGVLDTLGRTLMIDNYNRREAELSLDEFTWHESRKLNKAAIEGTKFDIGMVCLADEIEFDTNQYRKQGMRTIKTTVVDDHRAFDFPAHYVVDDEMTPYVLSFTHTYVGQAKLGETIEVSGAVERNITTGKCRLIVGSSREAEGEYIKVCR
ncbi:MAG: nucleotidyltransferase domain-containing protein [Methylophagaceae bacterium]